MRWVRSFSFKQAATFERYSGDEAGASFSIFHNKLAEFTTVFYTGFKMSVFRNWVRAFQPRRRGLLGGPLPGRSGGLTKEA